MAARHPRFGGKTPLELARTLIAADTSNPPGREASVARQIARRVTGAGMRAQLVPLGPDRLSLVARCEANRADAPWLVLSGHLDTVPAGNGPWSSPPFAAEVDGDRLMGRGSSDMKAGVAALVWAAEEAAQQPRRANIALVLTASEEDGCRGARSVIPRLPHADALLVAEPTANRVVAAHKGALWLRAEADGVAAHGSAPARGSNAIYAMARAISWLEAAAERLPGDPRLGRATVNVGTVGGGTVPNAVPDHCTATIDVRTVPGFEAADAESFIRDAAGDAIRFERMLQLAPVVTEPTDPWVAAVQGAVGDSEPPGVAAYFTDASVLAEALGGPPTVICGPGEPGQAHATDEWCSIERLEHAADAYTEICRRWCGGG